MSAFDHPNAPDIVLVTTTDPTSHIAPHSNRTTLVLPALSYFELTTPPDPEDPLSIFILVPCRAFTIVNSGPGLYLAGTWTLLLQLAIPPASSSDSNRISSGSIHYHQDSGAASAQNQLPSFARMDPPAPGPPPPASIGNPSVPPPVPVPLPVQEARRPSLAMSVTSATSPSSAGSATPDPTTGTAGMTQKEIDLQRKRARDRKAQQAMRDRNKWTIHTLTEQVAFLNHAVEEKNRQIFILQARLGALENENAHLRTQNAALQLSLMGRENEEAAAAAAGASAGNPLPDGATRALTAPRLGQVAAATTLHPWEILPKDTSPTCLADEILQNFIDSVRTKALISPKPAHERAAAYSRKPRVCSLMDPRRRTEDVISNVVADIVRSYPEIETLPKQVAVFWNMALLLKWMVLLDRDSWEQMPPWLRPIPSQRAIPHAAWIDRIPWPKAREYLIMHPEITLDDWAAPYSSSFNVSWPYDPSHVVITIPNPTDSSVAEFSINPVYEEHLRQMRNWTVGDVFRKRFPELATLIDEERGS
ncbi:hypothetical protein SODALDRAFT_360336 [Sodiomyces alkalinus F11]|uniref:BZIP domain-containing protein n=1 Tax=Sodiomyces alkalinus (strain CBS 110278 / VKM F-3762 / F11) TaxID=1314773 RepID=A0A3N2PU45_SODAK|nr:hypothetical protein SODALDRAFT_360336 [Sodiomyces alkalinus F11]ROT38015.1 hypothetical protein SODALDRAFT_360336 [Sodiomyces alkalinus F11]